MGIYIYIYIYIYTYICADTASAQRLAFAFIPPRVDYCNAVLAGFPISTLAPKQRVLNAAVRLMAVGTSCTHVSGIMKSLHWLPIVYLIRFKLCVLMHSVHNGISPSYLTDTTTPISLFPGRRQLRSAMTTQYDIRRTRTTFGGSFRCCWIARVELSSRRYKEHYRSVILQMSHQDTLSCIGIFGLNSVTFPDCTMFGASGQFYGGRGLRCAIEMGFTYLLTYLRGDGIRCASLGQSLFM